MSQSLSKLYVHVIFHVKDEQIAIRPEDEKELYAYIGGIIKQNGSFPIKINRSKMNILNFCRNMRLILMKIICGNNYIVLSGRKLDGAIPLPKTLPLGWVIESFQPFLL